MLVEKDKSVRNCVCRKTLRIKHCEIREIVVLWKICVFFFMFFYCNRSIREYDARLKYIEIVFERELCTYLLKIKD